jgi:hypothetical protein
MNMSLSDQENFIKLQASFSSIPSQYSYYFDDFIVTSNNMSTAIHKVIEDANSGKIGRRRLQFDAALASNNDSSISVMVIITKTNLNLIDFPLYSDTDALFAQIQTRLNHAVMVTDLFQSSMRGNMSHVYKNCVSQLVYFGQPNVLLPFNSGKSSRGSGTTTYQAGVLASIVLCSVIGGFCCIGMLY